MVLNRGQVYRGSVPYELLPTTVSFTYDNGYMIMCV